MIDVREALGAAAWEDAKGKLRAVVAILGSYPAGTGPCIARDGEESKYEAMHRRVEGFIKEIEDEELYA